MIDKEKVITLFSEFMKRHNYSAESINRELIWLRDKLKYMPDDAEKVLVTFIEMPGLNDKK